MRQIKQKQKNISFLSITPFPTPNFLLNSKASCKPKTSQISRRLNFQTSSFNSYSNPHRQSEQQCHKMSYDSEEYSKFIQKIANKCGGNFSIESGERSMSGSMGVGGRAREKGKKCVKRKVQNCLLGIGFQKSECCSKQNVKLPQHFFPQRSLSLIKRIAFKNSCLKTEIQRIGHARVEESEGNQKQIGPLSTKREEVIKFYKKSKANSEVHIKINSLNHCSSTRNHFNENFQDNDLQKIRQKKMKNNKNRMAIATNHSINVCNQMPGQELSPWNFYEERDKLNEDGDEQ